MSDLRTMRTKNMSPAARRNRLLTAIEAMSATSRLRSFSFRDPDLNLIEVANRVATAAP